MALKINDIFTIDLESDGEVIESITGTLTPLSKQQKKQQKLSAREGAKKYALIENKKKEFDRLMVDIEHEQKVENSEKLVQMYETFDALEIELEKMNEDFVDEEILEGVKKEEFEATVSGESKERLRELCETYGYQEVLNEIRKSINEGKSQDTENSLVGADSLQVEQTQEVAIVETQNSTTQPAAQQ